MVSLWKLTWDDENYYLIAYDEKSDCIKHYGVDKMKNLSVLDQKRIVKKHFVILIWRFLQSGLLVCMAEETRRPLCYVEMNWQGLFIDRFGKDVIMVPKGTDYFQVSTTVSISRQFFGWVTGVGEKLKIVSPKSVKEEYQKYLSEILEGYRKRYS